MDLQVKIGGNNSNCILRMLKKIAAAFFSIMIIVSTDSNATLMDSGDTSTLPNTLIIDKVVVNCDGTSSCENLAEKWRELARGYPSVSYLREAIKLMLFESEVGRFEYKLSKVGKKHILYVSFHVYPQISEIKIQMSAANIDQTSIKNMLPLKEGGSYFENRLKQCEKIILSSLREKGYDQATIKSEVKEDENERIVINFIVNEGAPIIIDKFVIEMGASEETIKKRIYSSVKSFINTPFDLTNLKNRLDEINKELIDRGYFFSQIEVVPPYDTATREPDKGNRITVTIKVNLGERYVFSFRGNKVFNHQELSKAVKTAIKGVYKSFDVKNVKKVLIQLYDDKGLYNTVIRDRLVVEKIPKEGPQNHYFFDIQEGYKIKLTAVEFQDNKFFSEKYLQDLFFGNASILVSRHFYDRIYLSDFKGILKSKYIENGWMFTKIYDPIVKFSKNNREVSVTYRVLEEVQTTVADIILEGIPEELKPKLLKVIENKVGKPLNTAVLEEDLKKVIDTLREQGYYFATIHDTDRDTILRFTDDYAQSEIILDIDLGEKTYLSNVVISGIEKTKPKTIKREVTIKEGDLVTPGGVERTKNNIRSMGIFSQLKLDLIPGTVEKNRVNMLVGVKERDYGYVELAPGFRTDLGLKLSGEAGRNNLFGLNQAVSFKGEVNRRTSLYAFDTRRRNNGKQELEYSTRLSYNWPYFLGIPLTFQASAFDTKKRYYSFDAEVLRAQTTFSKMLTQNLSTSLSYQLESTRRKDATDPVDNGRFRIGGITPAVTLDLRDSSINPSRGAYFYVSCERAAPIFYSQDKSNLEINYYKLISRNKFYLPIKKHEQILALSLSTGMQGNLVSNPNNLIGIPRDKVFRLNGVDIVRGFRDTEINRLVTGEDIDDVEVRSRAYFVNLKVEPRVLISDTTMVGLFLDAGRVFVSHVNLTYLRSSVGLSFKYLTPVGSIDFDYGIKLWRRKLQDGSLETPGEFHISIGLF